MNTKQIEEIKPYIILFLIKNNLPYDNQFIGELSDTFIKATRELVKDRKESILNKRV